MRKCNTCGEEKSLEDFPWHRKGVRHYKCKPCYRAYFVEYRKAKPEMFAAHARKAQIRKYGIEPEEFNACIEYQGGVCAICGQVPQPWFVIDHCHDTGTVRGALCVKCNAMLATIDSPLFDRMMEYKKNPPFDQCKGLHIHEDWKASA